MTAQTLFQDGPDSCQRKLALPWLAEFAYLAIKPAELLAATLLAIAHFSQSEMKVAKSEL